MLLDRWQLLQHHGQSMSGLRRHLSRRCDIVLVEHLPPVRQRVLGEGGVEDRDELPAVLRDGPGGGEALVLQQVRAADRGQHPRQVPPGLNPDQEEPAVVGGAVGVVRAVGPSKIP